MPADKITSLNETAPGGGIDPRKAVNGRVIPKRERVTTISWDHGAGEATLVTNDPAQLTVMRRLCLAGPGPKLGWRLARIEMMGDVKQFKWTFKAPVALVSLRARPMAKPGNGFAKGQPRPRKGDKRPAKKEAEGAEGEAQAKAAAPAAPQPKPRPAPQADPGAFDPSNPLSLIAGAKAEEVAGATPEPVGDPIDDGDWDPSNPLNY